ncbi:uncharacterized protein [Arachis hypogaea]|uniref:uncharacterized protein n=1 Tax=Arachis hypogaea TaxID=3818 RepID=UPI000DED73CF|nr:uncharacterized protein LOC112778244 [Arachis hypogaea]
MKTHESQVLLKSRRLFQQFLVDSYTMVEAERLQYHRFYQNKFRSQQLQGLHECLIHGETQAARTGKRVILPTSFVDGPQHMYNNCKDAFAICRYAGYPSYFITITCNPDWNEIKDCVADYSLKPSDRPDIISRVFKIKLDALLKDLKDGSIFGKPKASKLCTQLNSRSVVFPTVTFYYFSSQPRYKLVQKFMVHGPCGFLNTSSPCMVNGKWYKFYPMPFRQKIAIDNAGFPKYKQSDNGRSTSKRNVDLDNRFIVPYNATLLLKYGCHINVEFTCQTSAIKYLLKYVHKGNDRVTALFFRSHDSADSDVIVDEIQNYYDYRYISAYENILYEDHQLIENVIEATVSKDSMFTGWFKANKDFDLARTLTYAEMPSFFVWDKQGHMWRPRKQGNVIGHLTHIPHSHGEEYYLRLLLNYQKGCQTFADVRSVGGIMYDTFKEACYALGLLQDDKEFIDALNEASFQPSIHEIQSTTLVKIEKLLQPNGRSLKEFIDMPFPDSVDSTEPSDTCVTFDTIANAVSRANGGFYFVCGYGGTGKTFLWNALSASIRSNGDIVLNMASSGIAALLLPNG